MSAPRPILLLAIALCLASSLGGCRSLSLGAQATGHACTPEYEPDIEIPAPQDVPGMGTPADL